MTCSKHQTVALIQKVQKHRCLGLAAPQRSRSSRKRFIATSTGDMADVQPTHTAVASDTKATVPPKLKVLVSGAGIAGPCFAYWLARTRLDVSVTILERSPTPRVTGQSIDIRGAAIDIVKKMHLEDLLRARHTTEEGTTILGASGKPIAEFPAGDTFTAEYEILRADLSELFLDLTQTSSRIQYRYGNSIQSLAQTDKDVTVNFTDGSKDTYDLVVAADGSTSKTRNMILDESILKDSYNDLGQYLAYFSIPRRADDNNHWQWYNAPKGLAVMIRPHRNPATMGAYLCITMPSRGQREGIIEEALSEGPQAQKRILHTYLRDAGWQARRVLKGMDTADDFYMSRAAQVKLPQWTSDRALVIGDAAFATFGIGTTLAIMSGYVLAGELSKIDPQQQQQQHGGGIPEALERYEKVFRPIYATMEDLPPFFPQAAFPQSRVGLGVRNALLWGVSRSRVYKLLPGESNTGRNLPEYDWMEG